ncbi:DUF5658 family protein [Clostridium sp. LP20]|uniref:DUF5658 family protein n=1 Tax=Clostridium sp. LP20 TaxID=3418665 RepID=UPI003EE720E3
MKPFIKNYTLENIKKKFILLYALNVSDIVLTLILYRTGLFEEANGFMAGIITNEFTALLIKIIIPGILLIALYYRMQDATETQLRKGNIIFNIATCVYLVINISHVVWIALLPLLYNYL